jgi:hypothetical protein
MAEPTKKSVNAYPKVFRIPPDITALGAAGVPLINQMRNWHHWRMTEGVKHKRTKK